MHANTQPSHTNVYTPSSQIMNRQPYSEKVDVYSFALVLLEIVLCNSHYVSYQHKGRAREARATNIAEWRPALHSMVTKGHPRIAELIKACW